MSIVGKVKTLEKEINDIPIRADGDCIQTTVYDLVESGKPKAMIDATSNQAEEFISKVVNVYNSEVATEEVGLNGSGFASNTTPKCPTGLLYGRIQSGKTQAMILSTALAIDNGFKVVVVLTSDNVKLVEQTAERFQLALSETITHSSSDFSQMALDVDHIKRSISQTGLVLICSKNTNHLKKANELLQKVGAGDYPAILFDDEADQASLDTNSRKRSKQREDGVPESNLIDKSTINARIMNALLKTLRHHVFVQVTATPYCLFLQNSNDPLRPSFTYLLDPGKGYAGGEFFFEPLAKDDDNSASCHPLIFVDDAETQAFDSGMIDDPPTGLVRAIFSFLLASAIQKERGMLAPKNFLCHVSHKKVQHSNASEFIRSIVKKILDGFDNPKSEDAIWSTSHLELAYKDMKQTVGESIPSIDTVTGIVSKMLINRKVQIVNADSGDIKPGRVNFLVGGNILGRGLTIENLLVTYYVRSPKTSQMDTMYQHARMYGYREKSLDITRVYLPTDLALRFFGIHEAERSLREYIDAKGTEDISVKIVGQGLRATRMNVLDVSSVKSVSPGTVLHPPSLPEEENAVHVFRITGEIRNIIEKAGPRSNLPPQVESSGSYTLIEKQRIIEIIECLLKYGFTDSPKWSSQALKTVLNGLEADLGDQIGLFVKEVSRKTVSLSSGSATGKELNYFRSLNTMTLGLYLDKAENLKNARPKSWNTEIYVPSLFTPRNKALPLLVYNDDEE